MICCISHASPASPAYCLYASYRLFASAFASCIWHRHWQGEGATSVGVCSWGTNIIQGQTTHTSTKDYLHQKCCVEDNAHHVRSKRATGQHNGIFLAFFILREKSSLSILINSFLTNHCFPSLRVRNVFWFWNQANHQWQHQHAVLYWLD